MPARYRAALPQLGDRLMVTDGGLETWLVFQEGIELPDFASFPLLATEAGRETLRRYYDAFCQAALRTGVGCLLDTATWRANPDWGARLGYSPSELDQLNRAAVTLLEEVRDQWDTPQVPLLISGAIGPRGDGYVPSALMPPDEAAAYHGTQVRAFAGSAADMICALTMTNANEAIGIARAAREAAMPVAISFTVETDGRLPDGTALGKAIEATDAATGRAPAYYMINCAHPSHFAAVLETGGQWLERLRGVRANPSAKSHAELNEATELDAGDPVALAAELGQLRARNPNLIVFGGCCGTDERHAERIALACRAV
ncbi:MAG: homocysteine S-methyltransferase family protein [Pseudomonadota bacterium]